jgi:peptidoglycan-N-acetylglucosamine deacetylase
LLHGFGHPGGFAGGGYFGGGAPEETVINNYYDDAGRQGSTGEGRIDNSGYGDSGNDAANLQQAGDDLRDGSDSAGLDDASYDDSVDDSSFDDSSGGGDDLA